MKTIIMEHMPKFWTIICTILAYVIPVAVYKINKKIHKNLDPPWKQDSGNE